MKKILFITVLFLSFILSAQSNYVRAAGSSVAGDSAKPKTRLGTENSDPRVYKLQSYLETQHSPLAEYAPVFIESADRYHLEEYGLTYLVPAITGLESSYGKRYLAGTYNAYGWGGGAWQFDSWEDSIDHVTRVLREKYINRGADTIQKIGPIYAESPTWAVRVSLIESKISAYEPVEALLTFTL